MTGSAYGLLTPHQAHVVEARLAEEARAAFPVVATLSGSRAYGFASPGSDVDVKAVHMDPTRRLLGLRPETTSVVRVETFDGVQVDYASNEVLGVLRGLLQGNGSYFERLLGEPRLVSSSVADEMPELIRRSLSLRVAAYYEGFSRKHISQYLATRNPKAMLHALRALLTGTHLLRSGEVVLDLPTLLPLYGLPDAMRVVEARRAGVEVEGTAMSDEWLPHAVVLLEEERKSCSLPPDPPNEAEVEAWLAHTRLLMA